MNEKKIVEKCKNSSFHLKNEIDILEKHALRSLSKISVWSLYPSLISLWVGNCLRSPMWLCVCTIQLKGRWSTHTLNLRTLFAFGAKKARGLSAFFLLFVHSFIHSFNHCYSMHSACFVLHCFGKQRVYVSKYRRLSIKLTFAYLYR